MPIALIKRKRKRSPLKKLQDRLLDIWSEVVKMKAGYKCEICGKPKGMVTLNSHHIIGKSNLTTKWDLRNGCCLCQGCHTLNKLSAHLDPLFFVNWLIENRLADYEYLMVKKNERFDKDYIRIENELKQYKESI